MNTLNYFIEANAGIIVLYAMYRLVLSNETGFKVQRAYLMFGLMAAVFMPFVNITIPAIATDTASLTRILPEIVLTPTGNGATGPAHVIWSTYSIWTYVYLTGMATVLLAMMIQAFRLLRIYHQSARTREGKYSIVESPTETSSYSFFNLVVVGQADQLSSEERHMIILHEKCHGKLMHSIDVLLITVLTALFWFNPVIWLYRRTMLQVHEYQVDNTVCDEKSSGDYTILLAKTVLMRNGFFLAHPFNHSFILKRINMINRLKSGISSWKLLALTTSVFALALVVACTDQVSQTEIPDSGTANASLQDRPSQVNARLASLKSRYPGVSFEAIEIDGVKPESLWSQPGQSLEYLETSEVHGNWAIVSRHSTEGEAVLIVEDSAHPADGMTAFYEKISQVLVYPEQARLMGIEGKVFVQFTVQADGRLSDFAVLKGIGAGCDAAALNAVMQSDDWKPGEIGGKAVAQQMILPISFKLN